MILQKKIEYADLLLKKHLLLLSVLKTVVLHHTFVKILILFLSEFLNEYKVQKKSIYVNMFCNLVTKLVTFSNMCLLSFVINWMHPCWIKVLIYYLKNEPTPILWTVVTFYNFLLLWHWLIQTSYPWPSAPAGWRGVWVKRDSGSSGCSCSGPEEPKRTDPPELDLPAPPPHSPADAAPAIAAISISSRLLLQLS